MSFSWQGRDWILEEGSEGPRIVIPSPRLWPVAIFFSLWLAGWCAGEVSAAKALWQIFKSADSWLAMLTGGFLLFWLAGWTVGGAFAWAVFLFSLHGREVVAVREGKLCVRPETYLGLGWTREFDIAGMNPVRLVAAEMPAKKIALADGEMPAPQFKYAYLAIESGGKRWRLGLVMEEQRAKHLLHTLGSRFGLPAERPAY